MAFDCFAAASAAGQGARATPSAPANAGANSNVERAIDLAAKGRCQEALPVLKLAILRPDTNGTPNKPSDKQLEYRAGMATAKCAMSLNQAQTALNALFILKRDFPHDPEALYITTHYFSELAMRASQELAQEAPGSHQAHELEAEAFESQGRWEQAAAEYQKILDQNPNVPGIHFRLGRIALSKGESNANTEEPKIVRIVWVRKRVRARRDGRWSKIIRTFEFPSHIAPSPSRLPGNSQRAKRANFFARAPRPRNGRRRF